MLNEYGREPEHNVSEDEVDAVIDEILGVASYLMACKQKLHD